MLKDIKMNKLGLSLNKYTKKMRLRRFYIEETNDGKTYTAVLLDRILFNIVFFILIFIFFLYKTEDIFFTSILFLQLIILYSLISIKVQSIKLRNIREKINHDIVKNKVYRDLQNKAPSEFLSFFREVLEKGAIKDLEQIYERNIDLKGTLNKKSIGVKCYQYTEDYRVDVKDVREFFLNLKRLGLEEGMIITTSSYAEDVKDFIPKLKNHIKIYFINMDKIIGLLKKADMYPSQKEIEKIIFSQIRERRRKLKEYKNTILTKGKVTKYIILSVILYLWGRITPYQRYYNIFSVILLSLGIISIGKYLITIVKPSNVEKEDSFTP